MDELVRIEEKLYAPFYDGDASPEDVLVISGLINVEASAIPEEGVEHALKIMSRCKAAGEDDITVDLSKDGGPILLENLEESVAKKVYSRSL